MNLKTFYTFAVMIDFLTHIEKLLAANDHVIVPGLGGFIVQHQNSKISNNYILPPHATVSFNPLIKHNDGLLTVEISRSHKISYRHAAVLIDEQVNNILEHLRAHTTLQLGNIGNMSMHKNGNIHFTPHALPSFLPSNLGLKKISLRDGSISEIIPTSKPKNIKIRSREWMPYVAVFITFIALFISPNVNKTSELQTAGIVNLNHVNLPEITIEPYYDTASSAEGEIETDRYIRLPSVRYKLIVGVFESQENAQVLFNALQEGRYGNFEQLEILTKNNRFHLAIETFDNISSAVNQMEYVRVQIPTFSDAWVMRTTSTSDH